MGGEKIPDTSSHFGGKRDERTRKRPIREREQVKSGAWRARILEPFIMIAGENLPFLHTTITRSAASDLLKKTGLEGSFLIRNSETVTGAYTIYLL